MPYYENPDFMPAEETDAQAFLNAPGIQVHAARIVADVPA